MSFIYNKRVLFISLFAASSVAQAQLQEGFTVSPSIGYYNMDNNRGLEDVDAISLGLGYQFGNPWAIELVYVDAETNTTTNNTSVDFQQYRLDTLYHLQTNGNLTPYLAAGIGKTEISSSANNTLVNLGGGLKYALNDIFSLRADFRLINDIKDHELDNLTTLGAHFTFGGQSKQTAAYEPAPINEPEPVNEPAPVVEQAPLDSDNDGVIDAKDVCPNTTAGVLVDASGCALDDDKDGVPNHLDACANTRADAKVDAKGCNLMFSEAKEVKLDVLFATNSNVVNKEFYPQIEELAAFLNEYTTASVSIEGHTDNTGSAAYNKTLSEKRAQAIADILTKELGVQESQVTAVGYGEELPLVNNDTPENRQANRRVITIISLNE